MNKLCKRSLAAVLAVTMLTGIPIPALTFQQPMIANAVETQMNAAKALGLSDEAPDGFDEDDPLKNPYGRKTVTFGDANEVLVGYGYQGGKGVLLFR